MPDRPNFPIPENIHAEPFCLCLKVPNDPTWKQVLNGLLMELNYWYNWQRDEARSGTQCAHYWRELYNQIDWSEMSCCCGNQPPLIFRYGTGGVYEVSRDGGVTWSPAPEYDPRNTSTTQPNPNDLGIDTTKCAAADAVVEKIKEAMVQNLNDSMTAADIVAVVAAALLIFLSAGTLAAIAAQITAVGAAIIAFGVAAYQSAFTTDVWNDFRCIIFNNMSDDLSISAEQVDSIIQDIHDTYAGVAHLGLLTAVQVAGSVGLTNMARSGAGDPDADCTSCAGTAELWQINAAGGYDQVLPDVDGLYTVTSAYAESGFYTMNLIFASSLVGPDYIPCNNIEIVEDNPDRVNYRVNYRCHDAVPDALSGCNCEVQFRFNNAGSSIRVRLVYDDPCS